MWEYASPRLTQVAIMLDTESSSRRSAALDRLESSRANPVLGVPVVVEARDTHSLAGLPGVDETTAADINATMTKTIEEHQVARLETIAGDGQSILVLLSGV